MPVDKKTVVIICGPTAIGKTAVAIQLAERFKTQIISADSRQCYKELNIGVAKPGNEQLAAIHHYFINTHTIQQPVNAAAFEQYALHAADELFKQHDIAVMVGGTGLYIKAFADGMDLIPVIPAQIRDDIASDYNANGLAWLQQEVQKNDPEFWKIAEQKNPHRLMRGLEVIRATGQSITSYRNKEKETRPFKIIKVGLEMTKENLYERVDLRVDKMISGGLADEVKSLSAFRNMNALQTVGYREMFEYFDGSATVEQAIINIKTNTRQYAKRQMTWFKKDQLINWLTASDNTAEDISEIIKQQN